MIGSLDLFAKVTAIITFITSTEDNSLVDYWDDVTVVTTNEVYLLSYLAQRIMNYC